MGFIDFFWHLTGLALPAAAMALGVTLGAHFLWRKSAPALTLPAQAAIHFVVCMAVLLAGLVLTGHDGRMATYAALVLASAVTQALLQRRRA